MHGKRPLRTKTAAPCLFPHRHPWPLHECNAAEGARASRHALVMTLRELCSLNTSWIARSLCKLVQCSHRSCQRDARRPSPRPSLPPHQCLYLITTPARRLCAGNQLGDNVEHLVTWSAPARSLMNKQAQRGVLKQRKRERKISQICHLSRSTLASLASPGRSAKHFASTSRPCHSR